MADSPDALGDDPCTVTGIRAITEPGEGLVELKITVGCRRASLWKDRPGEHPWFGHIVQDRPLWSVIWAEIPWLSMRVGRCPPSWLQYWQQSHAERHSTICHLVKARPMSYGSPSGPTFRTTSKDEAHEVG